MKIVEEECDESIYWIEILVEATEIEHQAVADLFKETNEILAMTVASIITSRKRK